MSEENEEKPTGTPDVKPPVALPFAASMDELGKIIMSGKPMMLDIHLYWGFRPNKYGIQKLTIFTDEEAEELLQDPEKANTVCRFNSKWKIPDWEEQNEIVAKSQDTDPMTGQPIPNWGKYREFRIQKLLKEWDVRFDNQIVPVTQEYIKRIPDVIILALFDRFERAGAISPEEQEK